MKAVKWRYLRYELANLEELDEKLNHWGGLGWELVSVIHTQELKKTAENILVPEGWTLMFKQPAP